MAVRSWLLALLLSPALLVGCAGAPAGAAAARKVELRWTLAESGRVFSRPVVSTLEGEPAVLTSRRGAARGVPPTSLLIEATPTVEGETIRLDLRIESTAGDAVQAREASVRVASGATHAFDAAAGDFTYHVTVTPTVSPAR